MYDQSVRNLAQRAIDGLLISSQHLTFLCCGELPAAPQTGLKDWYSHRRSEIGQDGGSGKHRGESAALAAIQPGERELREKQSPRRANLSVGGDQIFFRLPDVGPALEQGRRQTCWKLRS